MFFKLLLIKYSIIFVPSDIITIGFHNRLSWRVSQPLTLAGSSANVDRPSWLYLNKASSNSKGLPTMKQSTFQTRALREHRPPTRQLITSILPGFAIRRVSHPVMLLHHQISTDSYHIPSTQRVETSTKDRSGSDHHQNLTILFLSPP